MRRRLRNAPTPRLRGDGWHSAAQPSGSRSYADACWASLPAAAGAAVFDIVMTDVSAATAFISGDAAADASWAALGDADFGRLRLAVTSLPARTPSVTLRLAGLAPALTRTVGVLDRLSSLRLRSGLSSILAFAFAFSLAFLALARLAARFSDAILDIRSAIYCSIAHSRKHSDR